MQTNLVPAMLVVCLSVALPGPALKSSGGGFHQAERIHAWSRLHVLYDHVVLQLRGGSMREDLERRMKEERERAAAAEQEIRERQERRRAEQEYTQKRQVAALEGDLDSNRGAIVEKHKRRLPEALTLENLRDYAIGLLQDGELDAAIEAFKRVLLVDPVDAQALFTLGCIFHDHKRDLLSAQEFYVQAVEAHPDHVAALKRLAWLHTQRRFDTNEYGAFDDSLQEKRDADAEACYRAALQVQPHDADLLTGYGSFLVHIKRDADQGQDCLSRAVQHNPLHQEAHTCYALFLESMREDLPGAFLLFKRAVQLAPNEMGVLWNLAQFLHKSKHDYNAAEKVYRKMLSRSPTDVEVLDAITELLSSQDRYEEGEKLYAYAVKEAPDDAWCLCGYACMQMNKGHIHTAEKMLKQAIEVDPEHAPAICTLGQLVEGRIQGLTDPAQIEQCLDEAENLYRRAHQIDPLHAQSSALCASMAVRRRKDNDAADIFYQRAVQGYPRDPDIQFTYGCFLDESMQEYSVAEVMFRKVLFTNPQHVGALTNLGNLMLLRKNDTYTAEDLYRRAIEIDPNDSALLGNYGLALHQRAIQQHANVTKMTYEYVKEQCNASYTAAEEVMEQVLKTNPDDINTMCNYGFLKAQLRQDDEEAERLFRRTLTIDPGHVSTMSNYALMVMSNGHLRRAEEMLMRAVDMQPSHLAADKNLRFCRRLIDKQRIYQLTQRHRMQYPTANTNRTPGQAAGSGEDITVTPVPLSSPQASTVAGVYGDFTPRSGVAVAVYPQDFNKPSESRAASPVVGVAVPNVLSPAVVGVAAPVGGGVSAPNAAAVPTAVSPATQARGGVLDSNIQEATASTSPKTGEVDVTPGRDIVTEENQDVVMGDTVSPGDAWMDTTTTDALAIREGDDDEKHCKLVVSPDTGEIEKAGQDQVWGRGMTTTEFGRETGKLWSVRGELERMAKDSNITLDALVTSVVKESGSAVGVDGKIFPQEIAGRNAWRAQERKEKWGA